MGERRGRFTGDLVKGFNDTAAPANVVVVRIGPVVGEIVLSLVLGWLLVRNAPFLPQESDQWWIAAGFLATGVAQRLVAHRLDPGDEPSTTKLVVKVVALMVTLVIAGFGVRFNIEPTAASGALAVRLAILAPYANRTAVFFSLGVATGMVMLPSNRESVDVTMLSGGPNNLANTLADALRLAAVAGLFAALSYLSRRNLEHARSVEDALAAERTRLARELHDVVAHQMTAVVLQAEGASAVLESDPERARVALGAIEQTSRDALVELRRMLGVLRDNEAAHAGAEATADQVRGAPQPTLEDARQLVMNHGPPSSFALSLSCEVPAGVQTSVYRIIQEALTNIQRHVGPTTVKVDVVADAEALVATISDTGPTDGGHPVKVPGAALGLRGMRERAELLGGSLEAGPRPGGGWEVVARIPLKAAAHT